MSVKPKILVVGCGAVGTMCAYALHKSGVPVVSAVLRSNYDAVETKGFCIHSVDHGEIPSWKPHNITRTLEDAIQYGPFDYVVVAMKNLPDVYSIPEIIQPVVTPNHTAIVLVQNGIGIEQSFLTAFPQNTLLSGVTMIGCEQNEHDILHNDPDILFIAPFPNPGLSKDIQQRQCSEFANMYGSGGAKCNVVEDITWHRWRKLVWNASFNTICAITNIDSGSIQDAIGVESLIRPAMDEIVSIASAAGYQLPSDIQDQMIKFTPREARLKPSMQVDVIRARPMEIEVILANPLKTAKEFGVAAPTLSLLYNLLKAKQWAFKQK
ncbi:ketopantoate reductase PanE/ApbA C terminal-domain-containing protein [Xylariales sp. PMI_506]|nr:ketopantoate reductase PanE/ApbA C terminal-domain-containing protein [Xylariales sp. PMI_506]